MKPVLDASELTLGIGTIIVTLSSIPYSGPMARLPWLPYDRFLASSRRSEGLVWMVCLSDPNQQPHQVWWWFRMTLGFSPFKLMEWRCNGCNWSMKWLVFCWIELAVLWKHHTFKLIFWRCPGALSNQQKPSLSERLVPWCGVSWCWCRQNSAVFEFWWGKMAKEREEYIYNPFTSCINIYYTNVHYISRFIDVYWNWYICHLHIMHLIEVMSTYNLDAHDWVVDAHTSPCGCSCAGLLLACVGRE